MKTQDNSKQEYEPYGDEWVKEISKAPKKWIIEALYKPSAIRVQSLEHQRDELLEALKGCQLGIEKMVGWEDINKQAIKAITQAEKFRPKKYKDLWWWDDDDLKSRKKYLQKILKQTQKL